MSEPQFTETVAFLETQRVTWASRPRWRAIDGNGARLRIPSPNYAAGTAETAVLPVIVRGGAQYRVSIPERAATGCCAPPPPTKLFPKRIAFTLIEVMLAVLILALLATAAAMSLAQPLRSARSQDLLRQLRSLDGSARQAAIFSGQDVRMLFDLSDNTVSRFDGPQLIDLRCRANLPLGYRIDQIRLAAQSASSGAVSIDVSPLGFSRSYALHLLGPTFDQWIIFAGLGGDVTLAPDDATTNAILATTATPLPGHDAD